MTYGRLNSLPFFICDNLKMGLTQLMATPQRKQLEYVVTDELFGGCNL
jgi:hypothetical protein